MATHRSMAATMAKLALAGALVVLCCCIGPACAKVQGQGDIIPYLLVASSHCIYRMELNGTQVTRLVCDMSSGIMALDYHYRKGNMYWTNLLDRTIKRAKLDGSNVAKIVEPQNGLLYPAGLAVDWINDKLYWTDRDLAKIQVYDLTTGEQSTVIDCDSDSRVLGLSIYPFQGSGILTWGDIGERAIYMTLIGTTERELLQQTNCPWPLAIDPVTQSVFWSDHCQFNIQSVFLNGTNHAIVLPGRTHQVHFSYGVTLFQECLFWTQGSSVYSTSRRGNGPVTKIFNIRDPLLQASETQLNGINAVHPFRQPTEFGFCDYEVSITSRGNYTWPETTGGNEVELECQLGPAVGVASDTAIGRRRCNTSGKWEDPQLEDCITTVALQLQQLEELINSMELTEENVGEVNQGLREVIDEAGEEDQTAENLQVVTSVFTTTAALLSEPTVPVEEDTVNDIVEVLDTIQVWPEEVVEDMGSDIVEAFEEIVTSLVEQKTFTNLTFVGDNLVFAAESIEVGTLVVTGRGFSASKNENGTLRTTSENVGDEVELLAPEEVANAFLSPPLFERFKSDTGESGIFFSLYESSSLFPIARESDSPTTAESEDDGGIMSQVGSPVVAATVSAGGQTEFRNLSDPVIVVLRLNTVLNGNITKRACVSYDFNLADGIGNWTSEGCETNVSEDDPNIVTCSCNHLTNFACLVDICTRTEGCELTSAARVALEVLSIIGVVLSLVGIILTIITLLIFKTLRKRDATKFHIQLCIAILCMLLVFVIGIDRVPPKHPYGGCVAVSALIHYFTLAAVMWMGAEALLMFQKLVIVFIQITTKYIVIVSIVCWVVPIIPVVIPLGIDQDFMVNHDSANDITFCFIGDRRVFFGAFLGPILAVLLFNLVMMVVVVTVLVRHMRDTMGHQKEQMKLKTAFRLLISITGIMSLFGVTWIFGALTISGASLPFQILFVVFNGFQGFFIFLFLCVSSKDARELWKESLSCGCYKSSILQRSHQGTGASKILNGGTKKPKPATSAGMFALTTLSEQKSEQPNT